jgi:HSP20 family molecular chaperone IbpA
METEIVKIVSMDYDEGTETINVEVPLPSARKETIYVEVYTEGFTLRAMRDDLEEAEYLGQFRLCCPVDRERARASFDDGLLTLSFPLDQDAMRPRRVAIK